MKRFLTTAFLSLSLCAADVYAQINLRYVDADQARTLLSQEDVTTRQWSRFDYEARLGRKGGTRQELIRFIADQARDWNEEDKQRMQEAADTLNSHIKALNLSLTLPEEIRILKTTMAEEGGAGGYTRMDYIVVEEQIARMKPQQASYLLAHELFHVLTRNNPDFREKMYKLIGFSIAPEEFEVPADLRDVVITNPDVNRFDSYARFRVKGEERPCAMLIYANKPYEGGSFFNYLTIGLMPLKNGKAEQKDGKTVVYGIRDAENFFEQVGRNTDYIINPEEILAENFAFLLTRKPVAKTPELIEKMRQALQPQANRH